QTGRNRRPGRSTGSCRGGARHAGDRRPRRRGRGGHAQAECVNWVACSRSTSVTTVLLSRGVDQVLERSRRYFYLVFPTHPFAAHRIPSLVVPITIEVLLALNR